MNKAAVQWAATPVALDTIDISGITELLKNNSDKLRLINIWSVSNHQSVAQFSDFVTLSRIYVQRDFELVNINTDAYRNKDDVLAFLKKKEASCSNYIATETEKDKLITAVDPNWNGQLPYALLVEPGGKIVYATQDRIDLEAMRKMIFNDPLIGRLYK